MLLLLVIVLLAFALFGGLTVHPLLFLLAVLAVVVLFGAPRIRRR